MEKTNERSNGTPQEPLTSASAFKIVKTNYDLVSLGTDQRLKEGINVLRTLDAGKRSWTWRLRGREVPFVFVFVRHKKK